MIAPVEEKVRKTLQWWRTPIIAILVLIAAAYIDRPPLWPGFIVACFGEAIQMWAASQLQKDRTLADSGPYAHVRNPMYLGRFFLGLGFLMLLHNLPLMCAYILLFAIYAHMRVMREEARLRDVFGEEYERYAREVRRWLPRLRPYRGTSGRRFSWTRIIVNHEYRNAIGLALLLVLISLRVQEYPGVRGAELLKRIFGL